MNTQVLRYYLRNKNSINIADIAGLTSWYDMTDESLITQDGSGFVSQVTDKTGNGFNATASGAARPQLIDNQINNLPALKFTSTQKLDLPIIQSFHDAQTLYVVAKNDVTQVDFGVIVELNGFVGGSAASNRQPLIYQFTNDSFTVSLFDSTGTPADYTLGAGSGTNWTFLTNIKNGATREVYQDNVLADSATITQNSVTTANNAIGGNANFFIAELIIYNRALTTEENAKVVNYIQTKYNL